MPRRQKPDPPKSCVCCDAPLARKRFNGTLESMNCFLRRKYCNAACMGKHRTLSNPSLGGLRSRTSKVIALVGNCLDCGTTEKLNRHHLNNDPSDNRPENVVILCASHHTKRHWAEGKKAKPPKPCSVCGDAARRRGLCQRHWQRFKKYGDPLLTKIGRKLQRVSPEHSIRALPVTVEPPSKR